MRSLMLAVLVGMVGAVVLHIVIIFTVPFFATNDAWSRVAALPVNASFVPAETLGGGTSDTTLLIEQDFTRTVVCRFEIGAAPIHLTAAGPVPFWSLAVFDRQSNELFSMNDRTASGQVLDVTLASQIQMINLREAVPAALAQSVLVELPVAEGYVILRTVVPDDTWEAATSEFLDSALCRPVTV
jgi:uncharacterized membrane protein